jgi:hypothetical protein
MRPTFDQTKVGSVKVVAVALIIGSVVAFAFLGYTLLNLGRLGISATHPRVLVEAGLALVCLVGGLLLLR